MSKSGMKRAPRRAPREVMPYTQKTLQRDRAYGFYWYDWLWRILRPALVFLCALIVVIGLVVSGWSYLYGQFFMPVDASDHTTIDFVIEKSSTVTKIGENLYTQKLIRNKGIFKYIVQFKGLTNKIQHGSYPLSRDMDINQIIEKLAEGSASNERTITILPGWTVENIADALLKQGAIPDRAGFLALANDLNRFRDSSYALQNAEKLGTFAGRTYALEGYLAPDTYRVYTNATPEAILLTLLAQNDTVLDSVFNQQEKVEIIRDELGNIVQTDEAAEGGDDEEPETPAYVNPLNEDQIIVLASIIEKEAGKKEDFAKVSAVFHNRLAAGVRLESCATTSYPLGIHRLVLTADELASVNGFNTYTLQGLPVGPICNPSKAAIQAAQNPDPTFIAEGYRYFCTGNPETGELLFAKTSEEHEANVAKYRALWIAYDQKNAANP